AAGAGAASDPGAGGAGPRGAAARLLPVQYRADGECRLGGDATRLAVGHRGIVPRQQTGVGCGGAAALEPGERGEGGAVGVVDAERDHGVVPGGGAARARGVGTGRATGGVGQRVVVASYDSSVTACGFECRN